MSFIFWFNFTVINANHVAEISMSDFLPIRKKERMTYSGLEITAVVVFFPKWLERDNKYLETGSE